MKAVVIKVTLKNLSSLTIAGGSTISTIDIPLNPFTLPASSIKGTMRTAIHNVIQVLKLLPEDKYTSCGEVEPEKIKPCDVCNLFGYPNSKSSGCFTIEVDKVVKDNRTYITRVSIDDKKQIVNEGSLFNQEVIPPNNEFLFSIYYRCDMRLFKLLLYSLLALRYWRLGRNSMIDVKVNNVDEICKSVQCDSETKEILSQLSNYMWEGGVNS